MIKTPLNPAQAEAVCHKDGPMMVLAGPGSGKTLVITERTMHLISEHNISPAQILVITFTKAAAAEMKNRFTSKTNGRYPAVRFGTLHSVFFLILRYAYGFTADHIIKEDQQYALIREALHKAAPDSADDTDFLQNLLAEISHIKNETLSLSHYYSLSCPEEVFRAVYQYYADYLKSRQLLDFDDIMVLCLELFKARPDILKSWQERFSYILVDEFQDINRLQYSLIRYLASPENNLFIVGDDDQSIYRFRGAKPEIMLGFPKDYPTAKTVVLDQNYRSTPDIVVSAMHLISHNANRFQKTISSSQKDAAAAITAPKMPCLHLCTNIREQNALILKQIMEYREHNIPLSEIAVLYRTNSASRSLSELLMEYHIPFILKGKQPNLYEHWIAKDVFCYLELASGAADRSLFLQIMNRPKRYLSRESLPEKTVDFSAWRAFFSDKEWISERITDLEYQLRILNGMSPFASLQFIRNAIGYEGYLKEYAAFRKLPEEDLLELYQQLLESARPFATIAQWKEHIRNYSAELREQAALTVRKQPGQSEQAAVTLSTLHAGKGLEYQVVFLPEVIEGNIPYQRNTLEAQIEEERRLFYVGVTRAKKFLHLYTVEEFYSKPALASRFLGELGFSLPSSSLQSH